MNRVIVIASIGAIALTMCCTLESQADITPILHPDGFSGNEALLTFEGVETDYRLFHHKSVAFILLNDGMGAGTRLHNGSREFGPAEKTSINNFSQPDIVGYPAMAIHFPSLVNRVGFEVYIPGGRIDITLKHEGEVVGTHSFDSRGGNKYYFYGLESSVVFSEMKFVKSGNGQFSMDNLRFDPVPAPGAAMLAMIGIGLVTTKRRRHA